MKGVLSVLAFLGLLIALVKGDICLGQPANLALGANCGGSLSCGYGLYCDHTGVCSNLIAANQVCDVTNPNCVNTATCKGPTSSTTCVANANPGEPCDPSLTVSVATCPYSCVASVCVGGQVGDSCIQTSDCITNLTCSSSNVCSALANGQFCVSDYQCSPTSVCVKNVCTPQITTGDCSLNPKLCDNPTANITTCIPVDTLNEGDFCGGNGYLCKTSQRCINNQCTSGRVSQCASGQCSSDEYCTCGGINLVYGIGQCQKDPCLTLLANYEQCFSTNCKQGFTSFTKSCMNVNCAKQVAAYGACSSGVQLSASILFVSLFALLASYFSKSF